VEKNRERLRFITGVRDERIPFEAPELCATLKVNALFAETETHTVSAIRWPVFEGLNGEGLLLEPKRGGTPKKTVIYVPHAGVTPEQVIGIEAPSIDIYFTWPGQEERMIIPAVIDRNEEKRYMSILTNREFIYRPAYQLGRHIIGYEIQEILALVDWLKKAEGGIVRLEGQGDGGLLAFYAAAMDTRIDEALAADYFYRRDRICEEPIDRNVFGLLEQFGDAEIASLIVPRKLTVVDYNAPELSLTSAGGGAPGTLGKLDPGVIKKEIERAKDLAAPLGVSNWIEYKKITGFNAAKPALSVTGIVPDSKARVNRLIRGMDLHTQFLLNCSGMTRREFWKNLDDSSPERIAETVEWYRGYFAKNTVSLFEDTPMEPNPKTRFFQESDKYTVYEVELDVFEGLTAYGTLLIPKNLKEGEKLPAVVCQHGLERGAKMHIRGNGVPGDTVFFSEVCEHGYVVFAPQGIFSLGEKFRFNQRQLNPLGKNLFSVMAAQHRQIAKWLGTLPFINRERIGFYGASYGGTTAMYVTPLVPEYCVSICSANFNLWNYKSAATIVDVEKSYVLDGYGQYEIFEFDMANTFDHSDMAKLIAPRPFIVERGHLDQVAYSETVGYEFGKVRYYYDHCLKMPDRAHILWMDGGHTTFVGTSIKYLDRFLK
jgi:cephalosporin-C deacetylase-like acetyl esterase